MPKYANMQYLKRRDHLGVLFVNNSINDSSLQQEKLTCGLEYGVFLDFLIQLNQRRNYKHSRCNIWLNLLSAMIPNSGLKNKDYSTWNICIMLLPQGTNLLWNQNI